MNPWFRLDLESRPSAFSENSGYPSLSPFAERSEAKAAPATGARTDRDPDHRIAHRIEERFRYSCDMPAPVLRLRRPRSTREEDPDRFGGARSASPCPSCLFLCLSLLGLLFPSASTASADSSILLESPGELEDVVATTFDRDGHPVGTSIFEVEALDEGLHHMRIEMSIDGGGRNVSEALLEAVEEERTEGSRDAAAPPSDSTSLRRFRVLEEESQATRADGVRLPFLVIDHRKGRVSCYPPDRDRTKGRQVEIGPDDRVVNVPMQLLFQPLVSGEVDHLRFRIATCKNGPVLYRIVAVRGPTGRYGERRFVEIRYGPDLGNTVAWLASRLLPRFSFWFDRDTGQYLGHRMPLHRKGPKVLLIRQGLGPGDLGLFPLD